MNVRLTGEEEVAMQQQATAAGLSLTNWIRHKLVTGKFPVPKQSPLTLSIYQELRRIGINLNQATHRLNHGEYVPEINRLLTELTELHTHVLEKLLSHDSQPDQR